jgi:ferredoxin
MGFLINSQIHPFIKSNPNLLSCQVRIETADYKCLKHTSYIDCLDIYDFSDKVLTDERDSINIVTKALIKKAVKNCPTIKIRYQKMILKND